MKPTLRSISEKLLTLEEERYPGDEMIVDPETGFSITTSEKRRSRF